MSAPDLTTLADVKAYLGLESVAEDANLSRHIKAASAWIRSYLNRDVTSSSYTETLDGTGTATLMVGEYPITAVASVTVGGLAVTGVVGRQATLARTDGGTFPAGIGNVVVTYTAGYATVPEDIAQACLEMVAWRFDERKRIGHASKSIQGEVVAFQTQDVPANVKTLLKNWRRVVPQ